MNLSGQPYTSIWYEPSTDQVLYIDQTVLPWELKISEMNTFEDGIRAINDMEVRGAPLIGVAAGFALYLGLREEMQKKLKSGERVVRGKAEERGRMGESAENETNETNEKIMKVGRKVFEDLAERLLETRPTAVNLARAVDDLHYSLYGLPFNSKTLKTNKSSYIQNSHRSPVTGHRSLVTGHRSPVTGHRSPVTVHLSLVLNALLAMRDAEIESCRRIGQNGLPLIEEVSRRKGGETVNILTHCNAGWLACVDYGTALAPVYLAHDLGLKVHVWVDETRPRNQGARLTAFELHEHGVPCTLITDNAGGHLMQRGEVDMVIVGADRITRNGDVANKIGTYLKALAAFDNHIPFYVAAPETTFDDHLESGDLIPIEERGEEEVLCVKGVKDVKGVRGIEEVWVGAQGVGARNPGFDVTPARLVTGFIRD